MGAVLTREDRTVCRPRRCGVRFVCVGFVRFGFLPELRVAGCKSKSTSASKPLTDAASPPSACGIRTKQAAGG